MPNEPLADAARGVADALYRLGREWEAAGDAAQDRDPSGNLNQALNVALSKGYPFKSDLDDLGANAAEWAEHVSRVEANPPGALRAAAQDIDSLAAATTKELAEQGLDVDPVERYRGWQTGGLGGAVGDLGAVLGLGVAEPLVKLLTAIEERDEDTTSAAATAVAAAIREGMTYLLKKR